jgi:hypothetical protein
MAQKENPIYFCNDMVKSILNGTKKMTRLIVGNGTGYSYQYKKRMSRGAVSIMDLNLLSTSDIIALYDHCPAGNVGDMLYVQEIFAPSMYNEKPIFKADFFIDELMPDLMLSDSSEGVWKPASKLPKSKCRIWLQITDIRIEKLQSITEQDALNEGVIVKKTPKSIDLFLNYEKYPQHTITYVFSAWRSFISLWAVLYGHASAQSNPFVWVISFKVISTTGKPQSV